MTICLKCGKNKANNKFPIDSARKNGHHPYCYKCKAAEQRIRNKIELEARKRLPKKCRKCGLTEPNIEFPSRSSHNCWNCHEEALKLHIKRKPLNNEMAIRRKQQSKNRRNNRKCELIEMMGGACANCGIKLGNKWPSACFDFHHEGEKEVNISKLIHSWKTKYGQLVKELHKCILLCSNCHRKHHFNNN